MTAIEPIIVPAGQRQSFALAGSAFHLIARGRHTGGQFALYETEAPPGCGSAAHVHSRESESFLVLEGALTVEWDGRSVTLQAGDFVTFPAGCVYGFRNRSAQAARFLTIVVPGGLDDFLASVGEPLAAGAAPRTSTQADAERVVREARHYGVEYPE